MAGSSTDPGGAKGWGPVPIVVREATEADLDGVLQIYAQPEIDDGEILPVADARQIFARFRNYPNYRLYVAVDGDEVVGTFALLIMDNLGHLGAPSGLVEDVAVLPDRHGLGIGKQMMRFALDRCREAGCYKMALSANLKRDAAHAFYESVGFRRHGYSFLVTLDEGEEPTADQEQR
jgi:GNAT superfamily N-acetyltransferase